MKLSLFFSNSLYNCEVIVKDTSGIKKYVTNVEDKQSDFLEIDVESSSFELTVIPKMPDYKSAFSDMGVQNWKDRLAQKVGNALCSALDKMLLRVGCTYPRLPPGGRDALRKYAGGIFLAKAGSKLCLRPGPKAVTEGD